MNKDKSEDELEFEMFEAYCPYCLKKNYVEFDPKYETWTCWNCGQEVKMPTENEKELAEELFNTQTRLKELQELSGDIFLSAFANSLFFEALNEELKTIKASDPEFYKKFLAFYKKVALKAQAEFDERTKHERIE